MAISKYNKEFLTRSYSLNHDKIHVIYCGITVSDFCKEKSARSRDHVKIFSLARFTEKKGHIYVLRIANLLREKDHKVKFIIAGKCYNKKDAKVRRFLRSYVQERSLQNIVRFIDDPDRNKIIDLFHESDIFLLPCCTTSIDDRDGIPVVLMEAMASKLPVISTTVSGIPELISHGNTGLLADEKDEEQLLHAIELLIVNESLANKLADNALKKVDQDFNITLNTHKMWQLLSAYI